MNLTRRSLFASAVALLALPRRVAAERLLGPVLIDDGVTDNTGALRAMTSELRLVDSTVTVPGRPLSSTPRRVDYTIRGVVVMTEFMSADEFVVPYRARRT